MASCLSCKDGWRLCGLALPLTIVHRHHAVSVDPYTRAGAVILCTGNVAI
jgi:hypothetical protein